MTKPRRERAPAKINLTLRVLGRRPDGYHELASIVVFADLADALEYTPGPELELSVVGPTAQAAGDPGQNLVLVAARALAQAVPGLRLGRFTLGKELPVAAGIGGGSSDAAAALRLLADANGLSRDDPRLLAAARATGADVPVCLDPRARIMTGIGERLSGPLVVPPLPAVLVNPGVALATADVFRALHPRPGAAAPAWTGAETFDDLLTWLRGQGNDLEEPAIELRPAIAETLGALRAAEGCRLARMSGSGATCFALFDTLGDARAAARRLGHARPGWWVRATMLNGP